MKNRISDLITKADPGKLKRDAPLSPRGAAELAFYQSVEQNFSKTSTKSVKTFQPKQFNLSMSTVLKAAAGLFALIAVFAALNHTPFLRPVLAATPDPLVFTPVSLDKRELLTRIARTRLEDGTVPTQATQITWALNTEVDANGQIVQSNLEPRKYQLKFASDGSVHVSISIADPFPGQDTKGLRPVGTLLEEIHYPPGTYGRSYPQPPVTVAGLSDYFERVLGTTTPTGLEVLMEIAALKSLVALSAKQEAAIINYLGQSPGFELLGHTIDRQGRPGVALRAKADVVSYESGMPGQDFGRSTLVPPTPYVAPNSYNSEGILVISPDTGKLISFELIYYGSDRPDLKPPAVVQYELWE